MRAHVDVEVGSGRRSRWQDTRVGQDGAQRPAQHYTQQHLRANVSAAPEYPAAHANTRLNQ